MSNLLDKAIIFAVKAHSGTFRKGTNRPFITHPLEALSIASSITNDENVLSASVLHDTVEDTSTTIEDIRNNFGDKVAKLVAYESENKRENQPAEDTWKIRKIETLEQLKNASVDEQILVLADKLSNMRAMYRDYSSLGDVFWDRFNQKDKKEHAWYYKSIAENIKDLKGTFEYKEYIELLDKTFN